MIGLSLLFGLWVYKIMGSCVYKKTAEKYGSFSRFIAWENAYKLMRELFIGSVDCIMSWSDYKCNSVLY